MIGLGVGVLGLWLRVYDGDEETTSFISEEDVESLIDALPKCLEELRKQSRQVP